MTARIEFDVDAPPAGSTVVNQEIGMTLAESVPELVEAGDVLHLGDADSLRALRHVSRVPVAVEVDHVAVLAVDVDVRVADQVFHDADCRVQSPFRTEV